MQNILKSSLHSYLLPPFPPLLPPPVILIRIFLHFHPLSPTYPPYLFLSLTLSLSSDSSPGAIAGGVLAAFVAILACVGVAYYYSLAQNKSPDDAYVV